MLTWLAENLINIVLIASLAALVGLLIRGMVRDRRAGKCACGGDCSACGGCCHCSKKRSLTDTGARPVMGKTGCLTKSACTNRYRDGEQRIAEESASSTDLTEGG